MYLDVELFMKNSSPFLFSVTFSEKWCKTYLLIILWHFLNTCIVTNQWKILYVKLYHNFYITCCCWTSRCNNRTKHLLYIIYSFIFEQICIHICVIHVPLVLFTCHMCNLLCSWTLFCKGTFQCTNASLCNTFVWRNENVWL